MFLNLVWHSPTTGKHRYALYTHFNTSTLRYLQPLVQFKVNNIYVSLGIVHECGNTLVDKYFQSKTWIIKNNCKVCATATKLVLLSTS